MCSKSPHKFSDNFDKIAYLPICDYIRTLLFNKQNYNKLPPYFFKLLQIYA